MQLLNHTWPINSIRTCVVETHILFSSFWWDWKLLLHSLFLSSILCTLYCNYASHNTPMKIVCIMSFFYSADNHMHFEFHHWIKKRGEATAFVDIWLQYKCSIKYIDRFMTIIKDAVVWVFNLNCCTNPSFQTHQNYLIQKEDKIWDF